MSWVAACITRTLHEEEEVAPNTNVKGNLDSDSRLWVRHSQCVVTSAVNSLLHKLE